MPRSKRIEFLKTLILIICAFLLQSFLVPVIEINIWRPDLILIITILMGYKYGVLTGTISGFLFGIFQDSLSVSPLGISSLANCVVGFLAGNLRDFKLGSYTKVLLTMLLMLIHGLIFYLIYQFKTETSYLYLILTRTFPNTIYTFMIWLVTSFFFKPLMEDLE